MAVVRRSSNLSGCMAEAASTEVAGRFAALYGRRKSALLQSIAPCKWQIPPSESHPRGHVYTSIHLEYYHANDTISSDRRQMAARTFHCGCRSRPGTAGGGPARVGRLFADSEGAEGRGFHNQ
jgi:hypothetical protein